MVANSLVMAGKVEKGQTGQTRCREKPVWAAEEWQDISAWVEKLTVKVCHVDVPMLKSQATMNRWIKLQNQGVTDKFGLATQGKLFLAK